MAWGKRESGTPHSAAGPGRGENIEEMYRDSVHAMSNGTHMTGILEWGFPGVLGEPTMC